MDPIVQDLHRRIEQVTVLLDGGAFFSLDTDELSCLRDRTLGLSDKLNAVERGFLTVGLLGGTGVGKSTIMNALAGTEISTMSHRRPHTDHVVIYRHEHSEVLPSLPLDRVPSHEITHTSDAVGHIVLCDLPDFDSLMGDHREHVLKFLEHLDVLVWVSSPEKYADGAFYEFLTLVAKASRNFYFVLNKADVLFRDQTGEQGYRDLQRVAARFRKHIAAVGIDDPLLYTVSAVEARSPAGASAWNQFPAFRQHLFRQRDTKAIAAVKTANLDVEANRLLSSFGTELRALRSCQGLLEHALGDLAAQRKQWEAEADEAVQRWLIAHVRRHLASSHEDPSALVGPGYAVALILGAFRRRFTAGSAAPSDTTGHTSFRQMSIPIRGRLEWFRERIARRGLVEHLPRTLMQRFDRHMDVDKTVSRLEERFTAAVSLGTGEMRMPAFPCFRVRQYLTYTAVAVLLFLALGGAPAWHDAVSDPGITGIVNLGISIVHTLFGTTGLAALLSFALINLFFALRFYRRYGTLRDRTVAKMTAALGPVLTAVWGEEVDSMADEIRGFEEEIRSRLSTITALDRERTSP